MTGGGRNDGILIGSCFGEWLESRRDASCFLLGYTMEEKKKRPNEAVTPAAVEQMIEMEVESQNRIRGEREAGRGETWNPALGTGQVGWTPPTQRPALASTTASCPTFLPRCLPLKPKPLICLLSVAIQRKAVTAGKLLCKRKAVPPISCLRQHRNLI
jgi:hypothetical protein